MMNNNSINQTPIPPQTIIEDATQVTLIRNANFINTQGPITNREVLSYRDARGLIIYFWLYQQGHRTIFGHFYKARKVQLVAAENQDGAPTFTPIKTTELAIKCVSIEKYYTLRGRELEDPLKEMDLSTRVQQIRTPRDLVTNHVIMPLKMLKNQTHWYFVSQLANGGDLFEFIHDRKRDCDGNIANQRLFRQMTTSIHFLHSLTIFHRDLSAENFVLNLNQQGQPHSAYVIDFGQAMSIPPPMPGENDTIQHRGRHGKCHYLAPEIVNFDLEIHWKKVDVWALGISLWAMLFKSYPAWCFTETNEQNQKVFRHTNIHCPTFQMVCKRGELREFLEYNDIPFLPVHDLLQNMLRMDPQQRYSTEQVLNHKWLREER